jgi:membrane protein insertase Oxa1/YidC/SpoIIIJ
MNLACNPSTAGRGLVEVGANRLDCGSGIAAAIPFFVLVGLMVFTTYYQQRQMQAATPGGQPAQMQLMLKIMPLFLGFISLSIPAGVLVYWVTTNAWQIGQQHVMLRAKARAEVEGSPPAAPKSSGRNPGKPGGRNAGSRKKRRKR